MNQDYDSAALQTSLEAGAKILKDYQRLTTISDDRRRDIVHFIVGNLLFVLLHEVGHVMITEMGLPVLGREEDAADAYASVIILAMKDEFSERVLTEAAKGWLYGDWRDRVQQVPVVAHLDVFARFIKSTRMLETVAQRISEKYVWRAPFAIEAATCGGPRAEWNLAKRTITICYEMAEDFVDLYSSYSWGSTSDAR